MAVTYSAEQRDEAKNTDTHLVTIGVGGMEFQGGVSEEERDALARHLLDLLARRRAALKAAQANPGASP